MNTKCIMFLFQYYTALTSVLTPTYDECTFVTRDWVR